MTTKIKLCDDCQHGKRLYADGYIYRDWSGKYEGESAPPVSMMQQFWTYQECFKNNKGLKHINLAGDCAVYQVRK